MNWRGLITGAVVGMLCASVQAQDMFRCTDRTGKSVFQDHPCQSGSRAVDLNARKSEPVRPEPQPRLFPDDPAAVRPATPPATQLTKTAVAAATDYRQRLSKTYAELLNLPSAMKREREALQRAYQLCTVERRGPPCTPVPSESQMNRDYLLRAEQQKKDIEEYAARLRAECKKIEQLAPRMTKPEPCISRDGSMVF